MSYTPEILAVACPACNAAPTSKCYDQVRDGSKHRPEPHAERIRAAEVGHEKSGIRYRG
jgi:hypothetical protein